MTEIFVNRASGKVANQKSDYYAGGGRIETEFRQASFAENLAVMERIADLITAEKPGTLIYVTVSPVPLQRTFSGQDVYVANNLSKSTLRAALGQLAVNRKNVRYFPSYEMVMAARDEAWEADGRMSAAHWSRRSPRASWRRTFGPPRPETALEVRKKPGGC
jgi:hypothetical protein